jgi:hypothetical protein
VLVLVLSSTGTGTSRLVLLVLLKLSVTNVTVVPYSTGIVLVPVLVHTWYCTLHSVLVVVLVLLVVRCCR